ncbi:hypothetical protein [Tissierella sp.]|uniref:hypothetical protein n=1 Tax=Tissierella sp. TaxID=41274 RepID=UPI00285A9135|nr:hypothetical protein [Tissierella sp.]MDR7856984.1 hypothetical protein [Tissierella sp.]
MKEKQSNEIVDKNFFKAMSYEMAGEMGIIDNEDMKNNKGLVSHENMQNQGEKKKR